MRPSVHSGSVTPAGSIKAESKGGLITILWTLGLANEIELIADPGLDRDGLALALSSEKKRVFIPRKLDNAF